ncbi:hypothetical protein Tco_0591191 [Tanacetum coccineum]
MGVDFKHKSAWLFLKDKHKWKNFESTLARRHRLRVMDEEPKHFGEDALPRPSGLQRISKSQHSSNSTASSGSNPLMYQEMMKEQYELDRKEKIKVIERETNERMKLYHSQRIVEDLARLGFLYEDSDASLKVFTVSNFLHWLGLMAEVALPLAKAETTRGAQTG